MANYIVKHSILLSRYTGIETEAQDGKIIYQRQFLPGIKELIWNTGFLVSNLIGTMLSFLVS